MGRIPGLALGEKTLAIIGFMSMEVVAGAPLIPSARVVLAARDSPLGAPPWDRIPSVSLISWRPPQRVYLL